jgi:hypothetical protein
MKRLILVGLLLCGFLMGPIFPGPLAPALATVTDTYTPVQLTGDGSDTTFDFDFKIFNNTDLVVAIVDPDTLVATTQTLGTDYSVSINTSTAGGTVTFGAAPDDGDYVSIRRSIPVTQSTDIPSGGLFREQQIENALDKQTLVSQQLKEFQDRAVVQNPYATAISDLTLPLPSAGKPIKWNDDADGLENGDTAIDDIVTAAAASAASASSSASTATTQAGLATTARIAAQAARDLAQTYAAALQSTSTSSLAIGIGSKTFVTQAGKQFSAGQFVLIVSDANPANYMHGQVTSYTGTSLVVNVIDVGGSGTLADWTISVSGSRGAIGETGPEGANDKVKNVSGDASAGYLAEKLAALYPSLYQRDQKWVLKTPYTTAANRYTILTPNKLSVDINGTVYFLTAQAELDLSLEASWDTISGTDYRTAANRAGKDFYIYACVPGSGSAPTIKVSANSTTPSGYSASTSRKIGGFHGLCVAVGTISGHTLTDFVAGDVLPASIWDLNFKPKFANPEGMVFSEGINKWVDIYLASGTGSSTASVYGASITDTRDWNDFTDDGGAVKKKMLTDPEFQVIATGSNEGTNIYGSGDPGTTGGHIDTASRRMISNIGVEDACGVEWQWLDEQTMMYDAAVTAGWYDLPLDKGQLYRPIYSNDVKLVAGGSWGYGVGCGSRGRHAVICRWGASSHIGCRFCAEPV